MVGGEVLLLQLPATYIGGGKAISALMKGVEASFVNPALGLNRGQKGQIYLLFSQPQFDVGLFNIAAQSRLGDLASLWGAMGYFTVDTDELDPRTGAGLPLGEEVSVYSILFRTGYSHELTSFFNLLFRQVKWLSWNMDNLRAGVGVSFLFEKLYIYKALGISLDVGFAFRFLRLFNLAFSFRNITLKGLKFITETCVLPFYFAFSAGKEFGQFGLGFETKVYLSGYPTLSLGCIYNFPGTIFPLNLKLYLGYDWDVGGNNALGFFSGFAFGCSLAYEKLSICLSSSPAPDIGWWYAGSIKYNF